MDDGPESIDKSISMARTAVKDGIHSIVATPHTLNGIYINPVEKIRSSLKDMERVLIEKEIHLSLYTGADIHLCKNIVDQINKGFACTINENGKYILLELPPQIIPQGVKEEIFNLRLHGITPIITHPERHPLIQRDLSILAQLISFGALSQITSMSITGHFGRSVMACTKKILINRLAHVIASDAHSPDRRPPLLSHAVEVAADIMKDYQFAQRMVTEIPLAIISGEKVDVPEPVINY